jgi:hypothetical protein
MSSSYASLSKIRIKVRRLTKHLSATQITNDEIDDYINTFILYDFPDLDLDELKTTCTFFTKPYVPEYDTNTSDANDPLYNFKNLYTYPLDDLTVMGNPVSIYKDPQMFYEVYPKNINVKDTIKRGDGIITTFSGTLDSYPIVPGYVSFSSIGAANAPLTVKDVSASTQLTGDLIVPDNPASVGTINYVTGVYSFDFPSAPAKSEAIYSHTITYETGTPAAVLFSGDKFVFRLIPDKSYRVEIVAYKRPVEMLTDGQLPDLTQWWQFIAYGASKKILEDRSLTDALATIMPGYQEQEALVLARTIKQLTGQAVKTIYN